MSRERSGEGPAPAAEAALADGWGGPLLMLAAAVAAALAWTATRVVAPILGGPETVFLRTLIVVAVLLPALIRWRREMLPVFRSPLHLLRIVAVGISVTCFAVALSLAPLVQVTALSFVAPLFVLLLARLFLGERVRAAQWLAVAAGLSGVVLVLSPATLAASPARFAGPLLSIGGAFFLAVGWTILRRLHSMQQALPVLVVPPALMTLAVSGAIALPDLAMPPASTLPVLAAAALLTLLAHVLQIVSFRYGRPTRVAPVDFTRLLFATLFGALLLGETPSHTVLLGALLIVAAALYASKTRAGR
jgi:drug/metabolite transporter (DMT)-like permease